MGRPKTSDLTQEERLQVRLALRFPRGRYSYVRASQIAGIPERTVHDWAKKELVIPDFNQEYPKMWSYRDLVMLRLFAWFRHKGMQPDQASQSVTRIRAMLARSDSTLSTLRSDGIAVYLDDSVEDLASPQLSIAEAVKCLNQFDLMAPLEKTGGMRHLWGPNLIRPTYKTAISPWVLAGEPRVRDSRIPTATLFALSYERGLQAADIASLFGDLSETAIVEAIELETKMRNHQAQAA